MARTANSPRLTPPGAAVIGLRCLRGAAKEQGVQQLARIALAVDDDAPTLRLYRLLLEQAGMTVLTAGNGLEAIRIAVERRPHLVITDLRLPLVSGLEAIRQMRRHRPLDPMASIVITAAATAESEQMSFEAGCDAFLVKPVPVLTFLAAVRRCLACESERRKRA